MTKEEFKAKVSMAYGGRDTWEEFLEAVWQLHLEASNHWIPVKEEPPKVSGDYIICEKRGFVREAHYFELDDLWMLHGGALVSPTHWMPLPQAPRKEDKK